MTARLRAGVIEANHVKAQALNVAGKIVADQLIVGNIDVAKELKQLTAKTEAQQQTVDTQQKYFDQVQEVIELQQKQISELKKTVEELRNRWWWMTDDGW